MPRRSSSSRALGQHQGIILATILGLTIGIARLSRNWLVNRLALAYVELFRNTPLLVQLFVIYFVVFLQLPPVAEALVLPGPVYLSQRGVYMPRLELADGGAIWLSLVLVAIVAPDPVVWAGRRDTAGRPPRPSMAGPPRARGLAAAGLVPHPRWAALVREPRAEVASLQRRPALHAAIPRP
jgi:general L-amino acid transport system permease protein